MSSFELNKRHLRELLIYFFSLKKSAAEVHQLLVETHGKAALSKRSCRVSSNPWKPWKDLEFFFQESLDTLSCVLFLNFKNDEFDIEDKERSRRPKVYEEA